MKKVFTAVIIITFILTGIVLIFLTGLVTFYMFYGFPVAINGHAMEPSFIHGSQWIVSRRAYSTDKPARGDTVIFQNPQQATVDSVDRIIGLPGEKLEFKDNQIFVNDVSLAEPYLEEGTISTSSGTFMTDNNPTLVPDGKYFVLGDKREVSADSREFGFIPAESIKGRLWFCYYKCE